MFMFQTHIFFNNQRWWSYAVWRYKMV